MNPMTSTETAQHTTLTTPKVMDNATSDGKTHQTVTHTPVLTGKRKNILEHIQQWTDSKKEHKNVPQTETHLNKNQLRLRKQRLQEFPFLEADNKKITKSDKEILNEDIDLTNSKFSEKGKQKWREIALKHRQAFSLFGEVGEDKTSNVKLTLKKEFREDGNGLNIRPFRYSEEDKRIIQKELDKMESQGILKKAQSNYCSPILLVKRKLPNNQLKFRICGDYRALNEGLEKVHFS